MKIGQAFWNNRAMRKICKRGKEKEGNRDRATGGRRGKTGKCEMWWHERWQTTNEGENIEREDRMKEQALMEKKQDRQNVWKMMKRESGKRSERPWEAALQSDREESSKCMQRDSSNSSESACNFSFHSLCHLKRLCYVWHFVCAILKLW